MAARPSPEITLTKLRDGAPDTLAALCRLRGAAILEYSAQMAGRDHAIEAAAAAFARFRLAAITPGALTDGRQAEPLLRGAARRSVLAHVLEAAAVDEGDVLPGECRTRADQLVGYLEHSLPAGERETVDDHVTRCRVCATTLRRLQEGEAAFSAVDRPLPGWVGKHILTAMVGAAPLGDGQADVTAVRDEALALLSGQDKERPAAAELEIEPAREIEPEPGPGAVPEPGDAAPLPPDVVPWEDGDWPDEPEPERPAVAFARAESAEPSAPDLALDPESWAPDPALDSRPDLTPTLVSAPASEAPRRSARLARGLLPLLAVVAVAAAVGALLGIGLAKLSGDDAPAPALSTASIASTPAIPAASTEKLPIEVVSTTVRPLIDGGAEQASVRVHVRIENASDRAVPGGSPQLLVDDETVEVARSSRDTAGGLLTSSLAPDASADGTLRFDVASMTASELRDARVRLRIF
ncbi:MAG: hypothetical protein ACR2LK_08085, partial [Solirubrobacteraceae bacterium]